MELRHCLVLQCELRHGRTNPACHYGNYVKDDLNKAEQRWAQRRLFAPKPRRLGRWLMLLLVIVTLLFWLVGTQLIDGHIAIGNEINLPLF